ncbi:Transport permease protein OS=Streptomyces microflavus OX=1919 GN=G3I39_16450 PE=3 SV=1 [Streptomyces microflavus]
MSATTKDAPSLAPRPSGGVTQSVQDSLVVAKRNLIRITRIPEMVIFGLIQPIMFVVLFTYVFGGSISIGGSTDPQLYKEFLMAGIFAQTVTFATAAPARASPTTCTRGSSTASGRSPWPGAPSSPDGRSPTSSRPPSPSCRVLAGVALIVGWRTHENIGKVLCGFLLLLLLGYAFSWIGALIGLSVRSPEAATSGGLIWLFPLTFISNAFVPVTRHADVPPARRRSGIRSAPRWRGPASCSATRCRACPKIT